MNNTNASFLIGLSSALPSFFGAEFPYSSPKELLSASELSIEEKWEILSSWASDARAVSNAPALRQLDNGQTVGLHDILDALKKLDAMESKTSVLGLEQLRPSLRNTVSRWMPRILRRHRRDDDDDPPPCPAMIAPFPRFPTSGAESVLEAA